MNFLPTSPCLACIMKIFLSLGSFPWPDGCIFLSKQKEESFDIKFLPAAVSFLGSFTAQLLPVKAVCGRCCTPSGLSLPQHQPALSACYFRAANILLCPIQRPFWHLRLTQLFKSICPCWPLCFLNLRPLQGFFHTTFSAFPPNQLPTGPQPSWFA